MAEPQKFDRKLMLAAQCNQLSNIEALQRERNNELKTPDDCMEINQKQKEPKTMKATLIYLARARKITSSTFIMHEVFDTESHATANRDAEALIEKLRTNYSIEGKYIHVDGILFEITEKPAVPVLADVVTGIEI